jgi:hypothetical protein
MGDYLGWANSHGIEILIAWYVFSALVSSLPTPSATSSNLYRFVYTFLHTLAGSIGRIPYLRNIIPEGEGQTTKTTTQVSTLTTTEPAKVIDIPPKDSI